MLTSSNGNIFRVTGPLCGEFTGPGEFPTQRPVTRSFDAYFDLRLNKRLSKQSWGWWFETLSRSLWRHRNDLIPFLRYKCFYQYLCNMNIDRNMLVSYDTFNSCTKQKNPAFFVMNLIRHFSISQLYENADENLIYVLFMCHLTISPLWHVYSFANDRFNGHDGIRYSDISFASNQRRFHWSISRLDIVASKKYLREKFKVGFKFFFFFEFHIFSTFRKHMISPF